MENIYKIKPSSNILNTIGSEIIKDPFAAIIELVKNSYDADSTEVIVSFEFSINNVNDLTIKISDNGHGMSPDTVTGTWLVPATRNKARKKSSPSGRLLLGKKGIGRYASSILGNYFKMSTVDKNGVKTVISLNWSDFNKYEFLEDVPIKLSSTCTEESQGTSIEIKHDSSFAFNWNQNAINKLIKELTSLISPIDTNSSNQLPFNIIFKTKNCTYNNGYDFDEKIEPINLIDFYNYRIYGSISKSGKINLTYENACESSIQTEKIKLEKIILPIDSDLDYCGEIFIDLRVFDRDPSEIENLNNKIKNSTQINLLNKLETRQLLNEICGVNLYRNNFRIRPYGDINYDWLSLDKDRVQNPSLKIGNNQVCGNIIIGDELSSNLIERSSREGLKENSSYYGLLHLVKETLSLLEQRRAIYRKAAGKGRQSKTVTDILEKSINFKELNTKIDTIIDSNKKNNTKKEMVNNLITSAQIKTESIYNELKTVIATYQGQATLGKIVMVLLHEGSRPIQGLKGMNKRIEKNIKLLEKYSDIDKKINIIDSIALESRKGIVFTNVLGSLFKRIKPLSFKAKIKKKNFNLSTPIESSINIYENQLKKQNIALEFHKSDIIFYGYEEDILTTITNLIDNSIYWLSTLEKDDKKIIISIIDNNEKIEIHYRDNGPGIDETIIKSKIIFTPEFSTKDCGNGSGLGLPICGESLKRNNGEIKAISNNNGAYFIINLNK